MNNEKRNHDDDRQCKRPRAWRNLKQVMEGMGLGLHPLMLQLETIAGNCFVRMWLGAAMHHFLTLDKSAQSAAMIAYDAWYSEYFKNYRGTGKTLPVDPTGGTVTPGNLIDAMRHNDDDDREDGDEWLDTPHESLPDSRKVSDREFMEAMWRTCSSATMPELPDDFKILALPDDHPPIVSSGRGGGWRCHCGYCGRGFRKADELKLHIERKHKNTGGSDGVEREH